MCYAADNHCAQARCRGCVWCGSSASAALVDEHSVEVEEVSQGQCESDCYSPKQCVQTRCSACSFCPTPAPTPPGQCDSSHCYSPRQCIQTRCSACSFCPGAALLDEQAVEVEEVPQGQCESDCYSPKQCVQTRCSVCSF